MTKYINSFDKNVAMLAAIDYLLSKDNLADSILW